MLKRPRLNLIFLASAVTALVLGIAAGLLLPLASNLRQDAASRLDLSPEALDAASVGLYQRNEIELALIANRPEADRARNRARYLLAQRTLAEKPEESLRWLAGLEQDYALLAPQVLSLQAQAQARLGNDNQARETWQRMLKVAGDRPVAVEALVALAQSDPSYGDQAIARFPSHPKTVELVSDRLKKDPQNLSLLLLLARHGLHSDRLSQALETLVKQPATALQPQDWADIGFAYWEKLDFQGGAQAYAKAEPTAKHRYRTARSLQLSQQQTQAKALYREVVQQFPQTEEAGLALERLAAMSSGREALPYWDQLIQDYPERSPQALLQKSRLLDQLGSATSASQLRQLILSQHSTSAAAAELRWELAEKYAQAKQYQEAIQLTQDIGKFNADQEIAPRATFWSGRWQQALNQPGPATETLRALLKTHPDSYYAWRAASILGLPVGDFFSVQQLTPELITAAQRPQLPAASAVVNELYAIAQDQSAWELWQTEFVNRQQPSVAEQFTDGLLRLAVGDHLDGIYMVSSLAQRQDPEEKADYESLRRQPDYWRALYPLPYFEEIQQAATSAQLNPMLVTALIRQESRFMPGIESVVGAGGLMQVMPETADWVAPQIGLKSFKLKDPLDNLKMGTWYLNYTHGEWDGNSMLAIASYNAGPGNVADWVARFKNEDVDSFVEKIPFPETRGYVEHVFENYWNYMRLYNPDVAQLMAQYDPTLASLARR